jgi:signal transduction histidine kinase
MILIIYGLEEGTVFSNPTIKELCMEIILVSISAIVAYLWFNKGGRINIQIVGKNRFTVVNFFILILLSDVANMILFTLDENANSGATLIIYRLYAVLYELVLLYMIYNQLAKKILEEEQKVLCIINQESEKQYDIQKSLMENISIKSHDLKKQINYLRKNNDEYDEFLDELENAADEVFDYIDTNNHALSIALTQKSMICRQKDIPFNAMADGEGIDFMSDIDIYTLFANLLDNAIEASDAIPPEKRGIFLVVKKQEMMISIHLENYYSGEYKSSGDDFLTHKNDSGEHGFGVKSIRRIVEKYDGNVIFTPGEEVFAVNILIPIN